MQTFGEYAQRLIESIKKGGLFMRALYLLICTMFCINAMAQQANFEALNSSEKEKHLISLSNDIIKLLGPGYYREVTPTITEEKFESSDKRSEISRNIGRTYYEVTYGYDNSKESLDFPFSAKVSIWKDTGEPFEVIFGNGYGRNFFFITYDEVLKRKVIMEPVPYQQIKSQKQRLSMRHP